MKVLVEMSDKTAKSFFRLILWGAIALALTYGASNFYFKRTASTEIGVAK